MNIITWASDYIYGWRKYNYYVSTILGKYWYYKCFGGSWWHSIDNNIILGAIPLHNDNHLNALKNEGVGAVLSLLEDFERNGALYISPVTNIDWTHADINYLNVNVEDTRGVSVEKIKTCITFITNNIKEDRKIYIHCKAGRGRSASIVLCYLLTLYDTPITDDILINTYNHLKDLRSEVSLSNSQLSTIKDFIRSQ